MVCCRSSLVLFSSYSSCCTSAASTALRSIGGWRRGCALGLVFERHQPQALAVGAGGGERLDRYLDARERAATAHLDAGEDDPPILADGVLEGAAQLGAQPVARLREQILRRHTRGLHEVVVGAAVEIEDLAGAVDDDARRRVALQQQAAAPAPPAGLDSTSSASARARRSRPVRRRRESGACRGASVRCGDRSATSSTPPRTGPPAVRSPRRCPGTGSRLRAAQSAAAG